MGLLFRQCAFPCLSREGCDSPRHPVGKLDNIIFCPRSLVIIGEITLQPEDQRHKSRFQLHSRNKKHCCNWIHGEIKGKKQSGVAFGALDFLKSLSKEKEVLTAVQIYISVNDKIHQRIASKPQIKEQARFDLNHQERHQGAISTL